MRPYISKILSWHLISGAVLTMAGYFFFFRIASKLSAISLSTFDQLASSWIYALRTPWLTPMMQLLTRLGPPVFVIVGILVLTGVGVYYNQRFVMISLNITMAGAFFFNELFKLLYHRARPELPWLDLATGFSYPSGHAFLSFVFYGFLGYLVFRRTTWPRWRIGAGLGLLVLPILIGISRIYLGVHYPSDVIGGWALAIGWLGTCIIAMESIDAKLHHPPNT